MLCPKCGNECEQDAAFCTNCGEYVKQSETVPSQSVIEAFSDVSVETEPNAEMQSEPNSQEQDPTVKVYNITVPKAPKKNNVAKAILIVVLCVLLVGLAVFGIVTYLNLQKGDDAEVDSVESSYTDQSEDTSVDNSSEDTSVSSQEAPSKLTAKYLVGDWAFNVPAGNMISLTQGVPESFTTNAQLPLVMRFNSDKTVNVLCKTEDYKNTYLAMAHDYAEYLKNGGIYEVYELNGGYTREQVDNMMEEYSTTPELIAQNIEEDLKSQIENGELWQEKSMTEDGYIYLTDPQKQTEYELDGNTLTFVTDKDVTRETYFAFEYNNNTLTVTEGDYAEGILIGKVLIKTY